MHKNKLKSIKHFSLVILILFAVFIKAATPSQPAEALEKLDFSKNSQIGEPYSVPYFSDIVYVGGGNYFVIDGQNSQILKFNSQNQVVEIIQNDSIKNKNQLNGVDEDGNFFVRGSCGNEVYKLNPAGEVIKTISVAGYQQCYSGVKVTDSGEISITASVYSGSQLVDSTVAFFSEEGIVTKSISANTIGYGGSRFSDSFKVGDRVYLLVQHNGNTYSIAEYNLQTNTVENSFPIANGSGAAKSLAFNNGKLYVQNTHSTDNFFVYDTDGNLIETISSSVQLTAGNGFALTENGDILAVGGHSIYIFGSEGLVSVPIDLGNNNSLTELSSSAIGVDCNIFTLSSDGDYGIVIKEFKQSGEYIRNIDIDLGEVGEIDPYSSKLYVSKTGDLYIYGESIQDQNGESIGIVKVNSDGSLSKVFTKGDYDIHQITDMEVLENGDLYISGAFYDYDTGERYLMIKVSNGNTEMLALTYMAENNEEYNEYYANQANSFAIIDGKIYMTGDLQYHNADTGEWISNFMWVYDESGEIVKTVPVNYQDYTLSTYMKGIMNTDDQGNIYIMFSPANVGHEGEEYSTIIFNKDLNIIDSIKSSEIVIDGEDAVDFDVDCRGRLYYSYTVGFINVFANSDDSGLDCSCNEKPVDPISPIEPEIPEVPNTGVEKPSNVSS